MRRIKWKLLMAPLVILFLYACSPDQYQQTKEYDDIYFTSADRQQTPRIVAQPVEVTPAANAQIISLENTSSRTLEPALVQKYASPTKQVAYYEVTEPKVKRASELNYNDFVWDYENNLLKYYELPIDWETEWDERSFDRLVRDDFYFAQAWYDQYYRGDSDRMDEYLASQLGRNNFSAANRRPNININLGWGWNSGWGWNNGWGLNAGFGWGDLWLGAGIGFWDPWALNRPFELTLGVGDSMTHSFMTRFLGNTFAWGGSSWRRWNRWNRSAWRNGWWGNCFGRPIINNVFVGNSFENFYAANGRQYTRSGRLRSTSVTSVRSDALNGTVANRRSGRVSTTNSRITRSSVNNISSARGSRSSSSRSGVSTRSSRAASSNISSARSSRSSSNSRSSVGSSRSSRTTMSNVNTARSSRSQELLLGLF